MSASNFQNMSRGSAAPASLITYFFSTITIIWIFSNLRKVPAQQSSQITELHFPELDSCCNVSPIIIFICFSRAYLNILIGALNSGEKDSTQQMSQQ